MSGDAFSDMLRDDPRYPRAAYDFVREALTYTVAALPKHRHVSGRELCLGIRDFGRRQFGPLARTVFASWNVRTTRDFGNLVYNLIAAGEMGKTDEDDVSDFEEVYAFDVAFPDEAGDVAVQKADDEDE